MSLPVSPVSLPSPIPIIARFQVSLLTFIAERVLPSVTRLFFFRDPYLTTTKRKAPFAARGREGGRQAHKTSQPLLALFSPSPGWSACSVQCSPPSCPQFSLRGAKGNVQRQASPKFIDCAPKKHERPSWYSPTIPLLWLTFTGLPDMSSSPALTVHKKSP